MKSPALKETDFEIIFGFKPEPRNKEKLEKVIEKLKSHTSSYKSLNEAWGRHYDPDILEALSGAAGKEIESFGKARAVATFFDYSDLPETIDECARNI